MTLVYHGPVKVITLPWCLAFDIGVHSEQLPAEEQHYILVECKVFKSTCLERVVHQDITCSCSPHGVLHFTSIM